VILAFWVLSGAQRAIATTPPGGGGRERIEPCLLGLSGRERICDSCFLVSPGAQRAIATTPPGGGGRERIEPCLLGLSGRERICDSCFLGIRLCGRSASGFRASGLGHPSCVVRVYRLMSLVNNGNKKRILKPAARAGGRTVPSHNLSCTACHSCLFVCLIVICLLADSQLFDLLCDACRPYMARRTHIGDFWFVLCRECV
jgi:NAD-dependent dihydropyrimidine dehydrogenase PreA subunit